jgi:formylglycine-generating enzyme required for sulfatase activity
VAYAKWAGRQLPTEAQWEYAARGGRKREPYTWGDERNPGGETAPANIWQGNFPFGNSAEDGFKTTSPVGHFAPNGFGLYDMAGNVWEWVADWYRPDTYKEGANGQIRVNPTGPERGFDPDEPYTPKRVTRGGSYLCSDV